MKTETKPIGAFARSKQMQICSCLKCRAVINADAEHGIVHITEKERVHVRPRLESLPWGGPYQFFTDSFIGLHLCDQAEADQARDRWVNRNTSHSWMR